MTKSVALSVVTKAAVFPAGTVDTTYVFTITAADGTVVATQEVADPTATFAAVAEGVAYVASVTKNGVSASATFDVPADTVSLAVPDVLSVVLS